MTAPTLEKWFSTLSFEAKQAMKLFAVDQYDAYRQAIEGHPGLLMPCSRTTRSIW